MSRNLLASFSLTSQSQAIVVWSLALVVVIIAGLILATQVKKRVLGQDPGNTPDAGFTLSDLRKMVKEGRLTPEEFEKARGKIVETAKRVSERDKSA